MKTSYFRRKYCSRLIIRLWFAVAIGLCVGSSACIHASAYDKETAGTESEESEKFEVTVKGQYIYVYAPKAVTLRLYSILGQLITTQAVQPGTTRIKAPGRGVYILQAGQITQRKTINN